MNVIGIDLSLRATGYADAGGSSVIRVKDVRGPERLAVIRDELGRRIYRQVTNSSRPLVVLEGYSYGSKGASVIDIGELGGVIRLFLWEHEITTVEVPPAVLKRFSTGKGNAGKDEVLACAIRRWDFDGTDNNAADAHLLRVMGLHGMGLALGVLPVYAADALVKVEWPEGVVAK